jgi:hypothetical protein
MSSRKVSLAEVLRFVWAADAAVCERLIKQISAAYRSRERAAAMKLKVNALASFEKCGGQKSGTGRIIRIRTSSGFVTLAVPTEEGGFRERMIPASLVQMSE